MTRPNPEMQATVCELAQIAGTVANFCDHAEHNEEALLSDIASAARGLRQLGVTMAWRWELSPRQLYSDRLKQIELRNALYGPDLFDGKCAALEAGSWRDLQLVQARHDRDYHADVVGLMKSEQLRHNALHLAKLTAAAASVAQGVADYEDFVRRRVPDMILFGIKLSTVSNEKLSDHQAPELYERPALPLLVTNQVASEDMAA